MSAFDLSKDFVHLGAEPVATVLADFQWTGEYLEAYERRFESDAERGRLVCITPQATTWTFWERHPAGDELVVLLGGHVDVIQEIDGEHVRTELRAGEALINPRGVWHTADVHEPGSGLFVTPGLGTEHRPR